MRWFMVLIVAALLWAALSVPANAEGCGAAAAYDYVFDPATVTVQGADGSLLQFQQGRNYPCAYYQYYCFCEPPDWNSCDDVWLMSQEPPEIDARPIPEESPLGGRAPERF